MPRRGAHGRATRTPLQRGLDDLSIAQPPCVSRWLEALAPDRRGNPGKQLFELGFLLIGERGERIGRTAAMRIARSSRRFGARLGQLDNHTAPVLFIGHTRNQPLGFHAGKQFAQRCGARSRQVEQIALRHGSAMGAERFENQVAPSQGRSAAPESMGAFRDEEHELFVLGASAKTRGIPYAPRSVRAPATEPPTAPTAVAAIVVAAVVMVMAAIAVMAALAALAFPAADATSAAFMTTMPFVTLVTIVDFESIATLMTLATGATSAESASFMLRETAIPPVHFDPFRLVGRRPARHLGEELVPAPAFQTAHRAVIRTKRAKHRGNPC